MTSGAGVHESEVAPLRRSDAGQSRPHDIGCGRCACRCAVPASTLSPASAIWPFLKYAHASVSIVSDVGAARARFFGEG